MRPPDQRRPFQGGNSPGNQRSMPSNQPSQPTKALPTPARFQPNSRGYFTSADHDDDGGDDENQPPLPTVASWIDTNGQACACDPPTEADIAAPDPPSGRMPRIHGNPHDHDLQKSAGWHKARAEHRCAQCPHHR